MVPENKWIWFTQPIGRDHVLLAPHAIFAQSTAVGKFVINTIGEVLSSLDGKPTPVFGEGKYYQSVVFYLNRAPRGPWDADYVKGPIRTVQYATKAQAANGHLDLCGVYSARSQIRGVK